MRILALILLASLVPTLAMAQQQTGEPGSLFYMQRVTKYGALPERTLQMVSATACKAAVDSLQTQVTSDQNQGVILIVGCR